MGETTRAFEERFRAQKGYAIMSKQKITTYLIQHNHLWSYDAGQVKNLPDSILIEHALLYCDVEGLLLLFESFDKEDIRYVWEQKIVPHRRYHKLNFYLGLFFFRIKNIRHFLEQRIVEYIDKKAFRCYTEKQSRQSFWDY